MATPLPTAASVFRAFSDRTRLRILHLLLDGELCVCDIMRVLDMSQPKISRHLAYLRRAGLVQARREGLWMHYRLRIARGRFHESLLQCLKNCFRAAPEPGSVPKLLCGPIGGTSRRMQERRPEEYARNIPRVRDAAAAGLRTQDDPAVVLRQCRERGRAGLGARRRPPRDRGRKS